MRFHSSYLEKIKSLSGVKFARDSIHSRDLPEADSGPRSSWQSTEMNKAWFEALPELRRCQMAQLAAFQQTKTGALITDELAAKYGWKIGDHIPLNSTTQQINGSTDWTFDVVGIFHNTESWAKGVASLHRRSLQLLR